ncbi:unnamed protein product [Lampetra fluviatilis]
MLSRPPSSSSVRSPPSPATVASGHAAATRGDWGLAGPGLDHQQDDAPDPRASDVETAEPLRCRAPRVPLLAFVTRGAWRVARGNLQLCAFVDNR